jgi:peptidyl-dipeptidase A
VFAGEVSPAGYNKAWWDLRLKYQGVAPPVAAARSSSIRREVPRPGQHALTRYFLARILQFQFTARCRRAAGCTAPLHRCSIFESREAGQRLNAMLAMGMSKPWPDALEALTGSRQMDATAILDYFAPLSTWLDQQLAWKPAGW